MRDAFGSTFMFKLIIIFIVACVSFMTIAVSYAKVFRLKNNVINILEQKQYNYKSDFVGIINGDVDTFLESKVYNYNGNNAIEDNCNSKGGSLSNNGVCVVTNYVSADEAYYTVTLYLVISFPFFDYSPIIPVSGETEVVYTP